MKKTTRTTKIAACKIAIVMSLLLVILFVSTMTAFAAENGTYMQAFPDANFRQFVLQLVGNGRLDESIISVEDMQIISAQETLTVISRDITSLTGIEYFTGLKELNCSYNGLTSLDLSGNPSLVSLDCNRNNIRSLDLSNNTLLEMIMCEFNELTSVNFSKCPLLIAFVGGSNRLTELDFSNNPRMQGITCNNNRITRLDTTNCPELIGIDCGANLIHTLDISNNPELVAFYCGSNKLTSLDLSNNTKLERFICSQNELTQLDLLNNPELFILECYSNQLTELDISANPKLIALKCYDNMLTNLDISTCRVFESLFCYDNYMESPSSVIGWREHDLAINSIGNQWYGTFLFYPQSTTSAFNLSVSSAVVRPGDFVTVEVSALNNPGIMAFALNSTFDSSIFDFNAYNTIRIGGDVVQGLNDSDVARLVWVGTEVIDFDGGLYTLTFKVADDAPIGTYPITIGGQVAGGDAEKLKVGFKNGTITIRGLIFGDLNEDEIVDITDIVLLRKYLLGDIQLSDWQIRAADVNSDGDVDASDLLLVMRYIAGGYNVVLGG